MVRHITWSSSSCRDDGEDDHDDDDDDDDDNDDDDDVSGHGTWAWHSRRAVMCVGAFSFIFLLLLLLSFLPSLFFFLSAWNSLCSRSSQLPAIFLSWKRKPLES